MAIILEKGGRFNLTKKEPALQKIMIGLGWEVLPGNSLDLDASVFLTGSNKKLISDEHFIFYNNLKSPDGAVEHTGDNRTGVGEGDDEMILVNLPRVSDGIEDIIVTVSIHEAMTRAHNFGHLKDAYIRIVNVENNREILRYDLDATFPQDTDMELGRLVKENNEWNFVASGLGSNKGLQGYVDIYA